MYQHRQCTSMASFAKLMVQDTLDIRCLLLIIIMRQPGLLLQATFFLRRRLAQKTDT